MKIPIDMKCWVEMPEHDHEHSLFIRCLQCYMFGKPTPDGHFDGGICGNCNSKDTVAYWPSCCLIRVNNE
jgi:hypothetical protein